MLVWLSVWSEVRTVCSLHTVQLMPLHPKTRSSLALFKSRLASPFWYRLTEVVLEKRPLNGCGVVVVTIALKSTRFELAAYGRIAVSLDAPRWAAGRHDSVQATRLSIAAR